MNGYEYAKAMLQKNIQIIPLNKNKRPLLKFADIEITDEFIEEHKELYLNTNVLGILTRGLWCIDIDIDRTKNENGFDSIKINPFHEEIKENYQQTLVQITATGGQHIVFKKRAGVNYRQKIGYLNSVDIKAHDNNFFVSAGSVTDKGIYKHNAKEPIEYQGEFEERIFSTGGSFRQQIEAKHSVKNVLQDHDFSHFQSSGQGGLGKQAYERIVKGESLDRNNDLFLASTYAKQYRIDLEPLKVLIGSVKSGDVFTENEWLATVESANN